MVKVNSTSGYTVSGQLKSPVDGRNHSNLSLKISYYKSLFDTNYTLPIITTDSEGNFQFNYDSDIKKKLNVKILCPTTDKKTKLVFDKFIIDLNDSEINHEKKTIEFKKPFLAKVMEATTSDTPAKFIFANPDHIPNPKGWKFDLTLVKGGAGPLIKRFTVIAKKFFKNIKTEDVEKIFDYSKEIPKMTEKTVLSLMLNFNNPRVYYKDLDDSNNFLFKLDFSSYPKEENFKGIGLPEHLIIKISKGKEGEEGLKIVSMTIDHPKLNVDGKPKIYLPDNEDFETGLKYTSDTLVTDGEIGGHLSYGHLVPGYYAFLVPRNFRLSKNPLYYFYHALIGGIGRINFKGSKDIFSAKEGIFRITNLPQPSLDKLLTDYFTQTSYFFKPKAPIDKSDKLGAIKEILFKIASSSGDFLEKYKNLFVGESSEKDFIDEIWNMSEDMRKHGLKRKKHTKEEMSTWVDGSELKTSSDFTKTEDKKDFDLSLKDLLDEDNKIDEELILIEDIKDENIKEKIKKDDIVEDTEEYAFEPIMKEQGVFGEEEWVKFMAFTRYLVYSVLYHHIIHMAQDEFASDPLIASLSGRTKEGTVDPDDAAAQIFFAQVLVNFEKMAGSFEKNENIPQVIRDTLKKYGEELKDLGISTEEFSDTVNF
jgi:hypothetical protein